MLLCRKHVRYLVTQLFLSMTFCQLIRNHVLKSGFLLVSKCDMVTNAKLKFAAWFDYKTNNETIILVMRL